MYTKDQFIITNWCGIPKRFIRHEDGTLAVDRLEEMKDAGFNLVPLEDYGFETNCEALAACQKLGLRVQLIDERITQAIQDSEHRRELLRNVVKDYSSYPALMTYYVADEPKNELFPDLAEVCRILHELDPVHETYINILNYYGGERFWGAPTYDAHLGAYMEMVQPGILSYDFYPFLKGAPVQDPCAGGVLSEGVLHEKIDRRGFFDNFEDIRTAAHKAGIPFMIIIMALELTNYRYLTESEIRWEVFNSLCYGIKRISYFTYWEPYADKPADWDHLARLKMHGSIIERDGNRSDHYDQVARINRELQAIGDILLPYENKKVFHIGEESDRKIEYWPGRFGDITSITADRLLVGIYEGGFVMIANKDYETASSAVISAADGKYMTIFDKTSGKWKPFDGHLVLSAGDGELIRIQ